MNNLSETMRAVAKTKPGPGAELIHLPVPTPASDEVLVKIRSCAICGTDVHRYQWNAWSRKDPRSKDAFPRILGHEFCGEIVAVGDRVQNFRIGDRVVSETHVPCNSCYLCHTGNAHNCQNLHGFKNGIFSEFAVIPERTLVKLPDTIPDDIAATLEPFSVAVHSMEYANVFGDTVLVTGVGPVGLYIIKLAKAAGASRVFASDTSPYRRAMAKAAGADMVLDPTEVDVAAEIHQATNGLGVGTVFESSGSITALATCFEAIRKCGTLLLIGLPSDPLTIDVGTFIVNKSLHIHGIYGRTVFKSWETALQLISSGRVEIGSIITHQFSLFDEFQTAFSLCEQGLTGKVIFHLD